MLRDPRTSRVLHAIIKSDSEALKDQRRAAIMMLAALVGYDPAAAFDKFGELRNIHDIPPEVRSAITSWERKADGTIKVRFARRLDALKLMFAHFGDMESRHIAAGGTAQVIYEGGGPDE